MARTASDVNHTDIFPRRNLPGDSEKWGRVAEDRIIALESAVLAMSQSSQGANRNSAASLQSIAQQLKALPIPVVKSSALYEPLLSASSPISLDAAFESMHGKPRVFIQLTGTALLSSSDTLGAYLHGRIRFDIYDASEDTWSFFDPGLFLATRRSTTPGVTDHYLPVSFGGGWEMDEGDLLYVDFSMFSDAPAQFDISALGYANLSVTATYTG